VDPRRKDERLRPSVTEGTLALFRRNVLYRARQNIAASDGTAEKYFRMQRIGRCVSGLASSTNPGPIVIGNLRMIASSGNAYRTAVLLRTGYPVRKTIVSSYVIQLRR
jgi:hypothetical protein